MKKRLLALGMGMMLCSMVGCGQVTSETNEVKEVNEANETTESAEITQTVNNTEDISINTEDTAIYEGMDMSGGWVDSDKEGVYVATGFDIVAPEGAANVAYSYMASTGMAQLNYTTGNAMWIYRMKPAEELEDISEIYCEWNYKEEIKVAGMDGIEYSYTSEQEGDYIDSLESTRVLNWYDAQNKVTYSLSVIGTDLNGLDTAVYAENLITF